MAMKTEKSAWKGTIILSGKKKQFDVPQKSKVVLLAQDQNITLNLGKDSEALLCVRHQKKNDYERKAVLKENAKLVTVDLFFDTSNEEKKINLLAVLDGEHSEIRKYQALLSRRLNVNCEIEHNSKNTTSLIKAKGLAYGKINYIGKVKVNKSATGTKAEQKAEIILLNPEAECQVLPILEVENDDVDCSHGAAIGEIDQEQIFYLTSRGLKELEARKLILSGFMTPIIEEMAENSWKEEAKNKIDELIEDETCK